MGTIQQNTNFLKTIKAMYMSLFKESSTNNNNSRYTGRVNFRSSGKFAKNRRKELKAAARKRAKRYLKQA